MLFKNLLKEVHASSGTGGHGKSTGTGNGRKSNVGSASTRKMGKKKAVPTSRRASNIGAKGASKNTRKSNIG